MTTIAPDSSAVLPRTGLPELVLFKDQWKKDRLGEIQTYPEADVNRAYAKGFYIVADIITGSPYQLKIKDVTAITVPKGTFKSYMPGDMVITDAWREHWSDEATKVDNALQAFGVGALFTRPVGDGCASYVVTRLTKTKCDVEWRGFSADNWVDQFFGYGGSYRRSDIERLCGQYPVKHIFASLKHIDSVPWSDIEATGLVPKGMLS